MNVESKTAALVFGENCLEIVDFYHSLEDEANGIPYNCTFRMHVVSGDFCATSGGCEIEYKELQSFIEQLEALLDFKQEEISLQEYGYGSIICFRGDGIGHIWVSGMIYGEHRDQSLEFEFMTDQTVYRSFINELKLL